MLAPPVAKTKPKTTSAAESNRVLKAPRPSPGPGLSNQAMLRLVGSKSDHARHAGSGHSGPSAVPPLVHDVLRSPGRPLDPATRAVMEPRFGQDFGQVRLHTDERAAESARAVNASAYAAGRHLVFGAGRYSPTTAPGRRLLAHELAHSIQQGFAPDPRPRLVDDRHGALESEAAESAESVVRAARSRSPPPGQQRRCSARWTSRSHSLHLLGKRPRRGVLPAHRRPTHPPCA